MQFLILAYDAKDDGAYERRVAARPAHVETLNRYKASGNMHMGAALLDDAGKMMGSIIVAEFPSRAGLDVWLAEEPFITNKVWDKIEVTPCQIGQTFAGKKA